MGLLSCLRPCPARVGPAFSLDSSASMPGAAAATPPSPKSGDGVGVVTAATCREDSVLGAVSDSVLSRLDFDQSSQDAAKISQHGPHARPTTPDLSTMLARKGIRPSYVPAQAAWHSHSAWHSHAAWRWTACCWMHTNASWMHAHRRHCALPTNTHTDTHTLHTRSSASA